MERSYGVITQYIMIKHTAHMRTIIYYIYMPKASTSVQLFSSGNRRGCFIVWKDLVLNIALLRCRAMVHTLLTHASMSVNICLRLQIFVGWIDSIL